MFDSLEERRKHFYDIQVIDYCDRIKTCDICRFNTVNDGCNFNECKGDKND